MVWTKRFELLSPRLKVWYSTIELYPHILVDQKRIELLFLVCKTSVIPLYYWPMVGRERVELSEYLNNGFTDHLRSLRIYLPIFYLL